MTDLASAAPVRRGESDHAVMPRSADSARRDDAARPVEARGLVKRYGEITAVDHVDLSVEPGDVYGFLGPNGAGKTTTLRMLLGLISPSQGSVRLFGRDPIGDGVRALEGVAGFVEEPRFYPYLTGQKNLELLAAYDGGGAASRIDEALETVSLSARRGHRVGGYSHGMKQRLGIAAALSKDPELLILDEPTNGMDPAGMAEMRGFIRSLGQGRRTVLLSSHLMSEVEQVCDRVGVINKGALLREGTVDELRGRVSLWVRAEPLAEAERVLGTVRAVEQVARLDGGLRIAGDPDAAPTINRALVEAGVEVSELRPERDSLEKIFLELTQGGEEA
jgi:ABC-2 type transport system ATP-binding protein